MGFANQTIRDEDLEQVIQRVDGDCYVISEGGTWLPGCYENQVVAGLAFDLSCDTLQKLQDTANNRCPDKVGGVITEADVRKELTTS